MLPSPNQSAKRAPARRRIVLGIVSAVALGVPTTTWLAERGLHSPVGVSNVSAAEALRADAAVATTEDELPNQAGAEKPAGAARSEAPSVEYFPRPTKYEIKIRESLDKPTSVEFIDLAFEDCFKYLRDYHKINIWADRQALNEEGVKLDQPITLKLAGVSLRSVLKLLLEPVQLTYVIEDDVMKITTFAKANGKLLIRTYPVRDLYRGRIAVDDQPLEGQGDARRSPAESRPGDLEMAIAKSIEPDSWDETKGPGSMTYVREPGSLVIRQTAGAHEQILQLLRDLREAKRLGQGAPQAQAIPRAGWKIRGPKRTESYSIVGIIDLDGDGEGDSVRLHELIQFIGGNIDNEVDEQGVLRVDGRIPDDGRPRITEKTKFVVVGKITEPADSPDVEEINTTLKIAEFYKEMEDQARAQGVRVVALADFLRYIGYERLAGNAVKRNVNPPAGR